MIATTQKWGNSLAVRIPKTIAQDIRLQAGSLVALTIRNGQLLIQPQSKPAFRLNQLLKGIHRRNLHQETDTGQPVGTEAW
jgi:antitoxin MazE